LALRYDRLAPGPELAMRRPEREAAQEELLEAPSVTERRLRSRLGEMVAAQAVEDEAGAAGLKGGLAGPGLYHRYNAILKRVTGDKARACQSACKRGSVADCVLVRRFWGGMILRRHQRCPALIRLPCCHPAW
jgi:hypothetical protein